MSGLNPTFGLELITAEAFAGVNYMRTLAEKAKTPGFASLTKALDEAPTGNGGFLQTNVSSIFNKFTVFQYSALTIGSIYKPEGHFIGFSTNLKSDKDYISDSLTDLVLKKTVLDNIEDGVISSDTSPRRRRIDSALAGLEATKAAAKGAAASFKSNVENTLSNPTAPVLIKWGATKSPASAIGFQPYSLTDFMFCKDYGKIPNNRLITLRRYPFPIDDSLRLGQTDQKRNALPVAQAVTWFGSDTGNSLNSIGLFKWDMTFTDVEVQEQIITGNEVTLDDLAEVFTKIGKGGDAVVGLLKTAYATVNGSDESMQQASGFDKEMQKYQRNLYDSTSGPYWNRIYGPVNVIHKSSKRTRGMQNQNWNTTFTINFRYSFRSFNGMSPKIVALDLISNFINLTYNDAQFLGQLARYFPKTGLKMSPTTTEAFGKILTSWGSSYTGNNADEFSKILTNMNSALEAAGSAIQNNLMETIGKGLQTALMSPDKLGKAIPELISVKAALSDRPVGEWHIVVGNPLNPIFVMGDLLCTNVEMKWDEELGPDDFPTGVSFGVTLKQGKPRDKTSIERMLNHGETKLTSGMLRTSSISDTFGKENNNVWSEVKATSEGKQDESLAAYYEQLGAPAKARYDQFRNRFLVGYGLSEAPKAVTDKALKPDIIDDNLLLFYYQRQYGKN